LRRRYAVQEAPPASVGIALLLVLSVAGMTLWNVLGSGDLAEHGYAYAPGMGDPGYRNETGLAQVYVSIIGHIVLSLSPLLLLALVGLLFMGYRRLRPVYAALAMINLPLLVIGFAGAPLAAWLGCALTLGSVVLLFLPSANAWYRAQAARGIENRQPQR